MFKYFDGRMTRCCRVTLATVAVAAMLLFTSSEAQAQYYLGRRAVIARPVLPVPPPVLYGPTAIHSGPGSFSIRSPYFSFRVDSTLPPTYGYRSYAPYGYYRYGATLPRYSAPLPGYVTPSPRYQSPIPVPQYDSLGSQSAPRYAPGAGGGIPDLTGPAPAYSARPSISPTPDLGFSTRALADSARRLQAAISARPDDADVWLEYLKPDVVAAAAISGQPTAGLRELVQRYEGVTMNPELRSVTRLPGFDQTKRLLSAWTRDAVMAPTATAVAPAEASIQDAPSGLPEATTGGLPSGLPKSPSEAKESSTEKPEIIETLPEPVADNDV